MEDCFFAWTLLLANLSLFISVLFKAGVLSRCLHGVLHSCYYSKGCIKGLKLATAKWQMWFCLANTEGYLPRWLVNGCKNRAENLGLGEITGMLVLFSTVCDEFDRHTQPWTSGMSTGVTEKLGMLVVVEADHNIVMVNATLSVTFWAELCRRPC